MQNGPFIRTVIKILSFTLMTTVSLAQTHSPSVDQEVKELKEKYGDDVGTQEGFRRVGTLGFFETLSPSIHDQVLADLLIAKDAGQSTQQGEVILRDRQKILQKYLYHSDAEFQLRVYSEALDRIHDDSGNEQAQKIIQRSLQLSPTFAQDYICPKLRRWGTEHGSDTFLASRVIGLSDSIKSLWKNFDTVPGLTEKTCEFGDKDDGDLQQISIGNIIDISRTADQRELPQASQQKSSECREDQVLAQFHRSLQLMLDMNVKEIANPKSHRHPKKKQAPGVQQLMSWKDGACRLQGTFLKTGEGDYHYYPDDGDSGKKSQPIQFRTLQELMQLYKARYPFHASAPSNLNNRASDSSSRVMMNPLVIPGAH
jgi:hypothetical protein